VVRCPKCNEELEFLHAETRVTNICRFTPDGCFSFKESIDFETDSWKCPECGAELPIPPDDDEAAIKYLGGKI